jgi:hypothetical protein
MAAVQRHGEPAADPHGLGAKPSFPILTPVSGFDDAYFDIVSWDATNVEVKVTAESEFRLYVFR